MTDEAPDELDRGRRRFLTGAAGVVGGAGVVFAAVPFIGFMRPNVVAKAAGKPIEVDISKLQPGERLEFEWRGNPIWVISRTERLLDTLDERVDRLRDPNSEVDQQPSYAQNQYRSVNPEVFVVIPVCTHLGCIPTYYPEIQPMDFDEQWLGGFFCPCHGAMYDAAGRVYKAQPAPRNLEVPPHHMKDDNLLIIGEHPEDAKASSA